MTVLLSASTANVVPFTPIVAVLVAIFNPCTSVCLVILNSTLPSATFTLFKSGISKVDFSVTTIFESSANLIDAVELDFVLIISFANTSI